MKSTSVDKTDITSINIVDIADTNMITNADEGWDISENSDGSIMCYRIGINLTIVGNESGKILLPENSSYMFASFIPLENLQGLEILNTYNVVDMSMMFFDCIFITSFNSAENWYIRLEQICLVCF